MHLLKEHTLLIKRANLFTPLLFWIDKITVAVKKEQTQNDKQLGKTVWLGEKDSSFFLVSRIKQVYTKANYISLSYWTV